MQLPFFNKKSNGSECYFGLFLQEDKVTGLVFDLADNGIRILAQFTSTLSNGMDAIVEDIDDILFRLETDSNKKLKKTIFFVTSYYIDEDTKQIKREYKPIIKKITQELELEAMGFIECFEAVSELMAKKEGIHLNVILVELGAATAHLFIYKNDKQIYSTSFARTETLVQDLKKIFTEIKVQFMLPSRIVLYPYSHTQKEVVHLVNHTWSEDVFVHMPKIETLSEEDLNKGLAEIFYTQLKEESSSEVEAASDNGEEDDESLLAAEDLASSSEEQKNMHSTHDQESKAETEAEINKSVDLRPHQQPKEVMGFAIGTAAKSEINSREIPYASKKIDHEEFQVHREPYNAVPVSSAIPDKTPSFIPSLFKQFRFDSIKLPMKLPILIPAGIVLVLLLLLLGSEYFLHKELVKVTFPSRLIQQKETVSNQDLSIKNGNVSAQVTDSTTTTGKKDIGDKAKGEVTIRNFDDKDKTISKGTVLSADNKNFTLDQDVKVASASVSTDNSTKIAGQVKGNVTADTIGPDYNMEKNTKFHIGDLDFSTFFALNDSAFTGGTKKQAQTIAKKDIEDLKVKVLATGKKQGLDKMRSEVSQDQQIIDSLTDQELADLNFSGDVGDEAKTVNVKANVTTAYFTYSENDLKKLMQKSLQSEVTSGYTLPTENIQTKVTDAKQSKNNIDLTVSVEGKSIKQVSKDDILSAVKGKSKGNISDLLKTQFQAQDVQIQDKGISFFPWLPLFKKNITIEVISL